jgi:hypothetical protein
MKIMANASTKGWDIDWKKIGTPSKPMAASVAEQANGVENGTGVIEAEAAAHSQSGVKAVSVTRPQRPHVPQTAVARTDIAHVASSIQKMVSEEMENIPQAVNEEQGVENNEEIEFNKEVKSMENNTAKPAPNVRYAESVTDMVNTESNNVRPLRRTNKQTNTRGRDLRAGMELLDLDFMLGVIENTDGADGNDVSMRKLCFNEVIRTERRAEVDSKALKVYAVDADGLYGKDIQCQAMIELTERTVHGK